MLRKLSLFRKKKCKEYGSVDQERYLYCPSCGDEYRLDFTMCGSCNVPLSSEISAQPQSLAHQRLKENRTVRILPGDELLTVRAGSLVELKSLQAILKAEMIDSLLVSENSGQRQGCCGPSFLLQIKSSDSEDAMAVLAAEYKRSTSLDSHGFENPADVILDDVSAIATCPACSTRFEPGQELTCPECGLCF